LGVGWRERVDGRIFHHFELNDIYIHRLQHPRGLGRANGWIPINGKSADEPGSESTAASFAFNIPVRGAARHALD
jgi:hypothetical protein